MASRLLCLFGLFIDFGSWWVLYLWIIIWVIYYNRWFAFHLLCVGHFFGHLCSILWAFASIRGAFWVPLGAAHTRLFLPSIQLFKLSESWENSLLYSFSGILHHLGSLSLFFGLIEFVCPLNLFCTLTCIVDFVLLLLPMVFTRFGFPRKIVLAHCFGLDLA